MKFTKLEVVLSVLCVLLLGVWLTLPTEVEAQVNFRDTGIIAVTNSSVDIVTSDFWLRRLHCVNTTGTAASLTIEDGDDNDYFTAVSIAANSVLVGNWGEVGIKMSNGLSWQSGTNLSLNCQAEGRIVN
jgi:hypothetical protein